MLNRLLGLMPRSIRDELFDIGTEHCVQAGNRVPQEWLEGSHILIVTGGIASKFQLSEHGRISEVGMIGSEGLFPLSALLAVPSAPHLVLSQAGDLWVVKLRSKDFHRIIQDSAEAQELVRKYVYAFVTQTASNILSSEQTDVSERTARWLLMCHDRVEGDVIEVTHDALAQIAFAYRPTITKALLALAKAGLVEGSRGKVTIVSREGLREMANGSYGLSEQYWQKYIGPFGKDALV